MVTFTTCLVSTPSDAPCLQLRAGCLQVIHMTEHSDLCINDFKTICWHQTWWKWHRDFSTGKQSFLCCVFTDRVATGWKHRLRSGQNKTKKCCICATHKMSPRVSAARGCCESPLLISMVVHEATSAQWREPNVCNFTLEWAIPLNVEAALSGSSFHHPICSQQFQLRATKFHCNLSFRCLINPNLIFTLS